MPEEGINYVARQQLLTYEEMLRLISLLSYHGVKKVRITGGEPFLRKGLMDFLGQIKKSSAVDQLYITTNGTLNYNDIANFSDTGIDGVNLSLDSIDKERFQQITRRDDLDKVLQTLDELMRHDIKTKINAVVMNGKNIDDIGPMIELTKEMPISVRFLEEMPFNGTGEHDGLATWNHLNILELISTLYPNLIRIETPANSTASLYHVPGYKGNIGIIASYSRTFCGSCDRLRITPTGLIKTCLYDSGVMNIKDIMRAGASDEQLITAIQSAINHRAKDGWEAAAARPSSGISESMATIGG